MKNKITYIPISILTLTTALAFVGLTTSGARAATGSAGASVTVADACAFSTSGSTSIISATAGGVFTTEEDDKTVASITCNGSEGFVINARGEEGVTTLSGTSGNIATGTATSGSFSNWAFKVTSTSGSTVSPYGGYSAVPSTATPIINFAGTTGVISSGTFRTDYRVYVSSTQTADTYTGGVEYTITAS